MSERAAGGRAASATSEAAIGGGSPVEVEVRRRRLRLLRSVRPRRDAAWRRLLQPQRHHKAISGFYGGLDEFV
jgi:hypothetical protein